MKDLRDRYFDAIRGIAILMVVAIHTYRLSLEGLSGFVSLSIRQILNTAVPLFFALSGYFLIKKDLSSKQKAMSFLKRQIVKVYVPTLLWSLPFFFSSLIQGRDFFQSVLKLLICGYGIYYFVAVIIQFYLLLPLVQRHKTGRWVFFSVLLSMAMIVIVTYFNIIRALELPLILYAGSGLLWLMFFYLGVYNSTLSSNRFLGVAGIAVVFFLLISDLESIFLYENYSKGVGIKPSSFVLSFVTIVFLMSPLVRNRYNVIICNSFKCLLEFIGRRSFAIYLIHYYVIKIMIENISFLNNYWMSKWIASVIVVIAIVEILRLFIPSRYHRFLGI